MRRKKDRPERLLVNFATPGNPDKDTAPVWMGAPDELIVEDEIGQVMRVERAEDGSIRIVTLRMWSHTDEQTIEKLHRHIARVGLRAKS